MKRLLVALFVVAVLVAPRAASAFCGFYVSGADAKLFNNATQVVMMRDGTRTVLAMQNNYEGPPESFAMVVPVPVVLQKENVRTLPKSLFEKIDKLTAPRLVEYWEQDPCGGIAAPHTSMATGAGGGRAALARAAAPMMDLGVTVEAKFDVGEYDIVILSAKDSGGLDTWLRQESYKIPSGAEPYLRPYVQAGSKFFVAKVDPKRVTFDKGQAQLSPLRFHYDASDFALPVRLGLINSHGTQDLVVNILATQRYEPANYPSVTIPTNLDLAEGSKEQYGRFYAALFDRTLEKNPKAIVTEYAWDASTCDPCPGPALSPDDFANLGADALPGAGEPTNPRVTIDGVKGNASAQAMSLVPRRFLSRVEACWRDAQTRKPKRGRVDVRVAWTAEGKVKDASITKNETDDKELADCIEKPFRTGMMPPEEAALTIGYSLGMQPVVQYRAWTITRLHARYSKESLGEDIVFKQAGAIVGGRESRGTDGELEHGATASSTNNFQGRYAIRHPWVGPVDCESPRRGVWGGPWYDLGVGYGQPPTPASGNAFASRGGVELASFVRSDVPELGIKAGKGAAPLPAAAPGGGGSGASSPSRATDDPHAPASKRGCGCTSSGASGAFDGAALVALAAAVRAALRRRR